MLTRPIFNTLKKLFGSALDDAGRIAFAKATAVQQVATMRGVVPADVATDLSIAEFVLVFNVKSNLVAAGSPAHYAMRKTLGVADPLPWHKPRAPKNSWEMQDSNRVPSWLEESQAMGAIARTVTHEDLRAGPEVIAAVVRNFYKIGGFEDLGDTRAIQASDPTMKLFLEGVTYALVVMRPEWHDNDGVPLKDLPKGVDGRSKAEIEEEHERQEKIRRNEEARERNRARREKELAEYGALRASVLKEFRCDATAGLASDLSKLEFDSVQAVLAARAEKELGEVTTNIFNLISASVTVPEGIGADEVTEIRKETTQRAADLTTQLVLEDLNDLQAGWLRRLSNGDFKFRNVPLKGEVRAPGYVNKKEKAAARAVHHILHEYGEDVLNFALEAITGVKLAGPVKIIPAPEWLKFKGGDEVPTTPPDGAPAVPASGVLPPPPPPPAATASLLG